MAARSDPPLAELSTMSAAQLRAAWAAQHGSEAPRLPAGLLLRGLAYRLQENRAGGLSSATMRQLKRAEEGDSASPKRALGPGAQLVRTWHGRTIMVTVEANGYRLDGRTYRSLSHIAREVTGAAWSGPRFFGLTDKRRT
ncbi:DUF2924 domain-containing protein [Sphingomonas profundi]|uniref:DUF2924 domain-containing protein n=1 Tax=Alterirhizorhabdus profundi TaxID=2681549 RepID=UPI0012E701C9|nr:DUF2924 domain-containing protein [Sphingomonas profundi]